MTQMLTNLDLHTLASRRRCARLSSYFRVVGGLVPALPVNDFLRPIRPKRQIKAKKFTGFEADNLVERQVTNHSKCFVVESSNTDQYKNSFFVKTTVDWNHLPDTIATSQTVAIFKAAVGDQFLQYQ